MADDTNEHIGTLEANGIKLAYMYQCLMCLYVLTVIFSSQTSQGATPQAGICQQASEL